MNAVSTLLQQLVATAAGVIIPWIMIEKFGSEAYGATTSIAQFLAYISLFEGGIGRVARGALYRPLAEGDEAEVSRIYLAIKRFFSIIGVAFAGYALILAFFYYDIADVSGFTREYIFALVLAIAIGKFAEYMGGITNITLFNADQRQYVVNSVIIASNVINVIMIVILAGAGADIFWVKLASSLVFVLKPIIFTLYLKRNYNIIKTEKRAVLKNKATGIAQHMAYVIQNNTDVLILTVFADLKLVAVYSVYHLVTYSLRSITMSFTGGMEAVFGNMIAKGEDDELMATYRRYKFILTVLTVTFFGTAGILILPFVKIYTNDVSDVNYMRPVFAVLLVMSDAINCLCWPCFNLTIAANKLKESRLGAYIEAALNVVFSVALVFWDPLVGIAIGTLISAVFKSIYYMVFASRNILKINPLRVLFGLLSTCGVLLIISICGVFLADVLPIYDYWYWLAAGVLTVAVIGPVGLSVGCAFYPESAINLAALLKKKIKK